MNIWRTKATRRFALEKQEKLLQHAVAVWQRRGRTLLEINCGQGFFLPILWECGFDISATELRPELRQLAAETIGCRAAIFAAADDHLPFDDREFDWTVLHLRTQSWQELARTLEEALRVTSAGLLLTFWNSASLPYLAHRIFGKGESWPPAHNFFKIWYKIKKLAAGQTCSMSTLAAPRCAWKQSCPAFCHHSCFHALPFGAWAIIRLNLGPARPLTSLPLAVKRKELNRPEPAMEYGNGQGVKMQNSIAAREKAMEPARKLKNK